MIVMRSMIDSDDDSDFRGDDGDSDDHSADNDDDDVSILLTSTWSCFP